MASIVRDSNGTRRILFVAPNGKRPAIRLGKVSQRTAEGFKYRVEQLLEALHFNRPLEPELAQWVTDLEPRMAKRLARVGLIPDVEAKAQATLGPFVTAYIKGRVDVKPATKEVWRQGELGLLTFFGSDKPLCEITPGDADAYKLKLIGDKLAPMTVRKRLQFAKMIFRSAVRHRLLPSDPFVEVTIKAGMPDRSRFVTREETAKLLEACPNQDWRVIVSLARYGGLRCPSEVLSLRWQDVDWDAGRIVVTSPKTEHHPGKGTRTIPLFPELKTVLSEAFEMAPEGAVYIVDERMRASAQGSAGWRNCNLRTQFERIIKRAGLAAWPRLFPTCEVLGRRNSPKSSPLTSSATGSATARTLLASTTIRRPTHTSNKRQPVHLDQRVITAQKAAHARRRIERSRYALRIAGNRPRVTQTQQHQALVRIVTTQNGIVHKCSADGEGFDGIAATSLSNNDLPNSSNQGEAESEAVCPDSDLNAVIQAWAGLPTAIKAGIVALVKASSGP